MKEQNQRIKTYEVDPETALQVPPMSRRKKIEAMFKPQVDVIKSKFNHPVNRRQFLKASAITGGVALAASSGLIALTRDRRVEAVTGPMDAGTESDFLLGSAGSSAGAEPVTVLADAETTALAAGEKVPVKNCADALLKLLEAYGYDYVFWLTDDEITPVADKLTPYIMEGKAPHPVITLHEFGAFAAADGYAAASEKTGVVIFGANQGPMNAHGAFFNAYCGGRPIVAIGAHNPATTLPYNIQYWSDPGDLVREYTKWTSHFPYAQNLPPTLIHAFAVAGSHPMGPVLITTSQDVWLQPMPGGVVTVPDVGKLGPAQDTVPDSDTLEQAAELLVEADNPVIVADLGRSDQAVEQLIGLAELLSIPVVEKMSFTSFPWDHPLHIGFSEAPYLADADVVFVIEAGIPIVPETTKVIQLDVDPVKSHALAFLGGQLREADIRMEGEPSATIPALMETIMTNYSKRWGRLKRKIDDRAERWRNVHNQQRAEWSSLVEEHFNDKPISVWRAAYEIDQVMDDDTIFYGMLTFSSLFRNIWRRVFHTNKPKSWISASGGGHLGQALYGAVGIAAARPDRKVICGVGDLEFHMGNGLSALWCAAHHNLPVLYIVENNHLMSTTKNGQVSLQGEGYQNDFWWAHEIVDPMIDLSQTAKTIGVYGECVKEPGDLGPALQRAMNWVSANSQPAIVDVWTQPLI